MRIAAYKAIVHDVQAAAAKPAVKSKPTKKGKKSAKRKAQPAATDHADASTEGDKMEGKGTAEQAGGKRKRGAGGDAAAVAGVGQTEDGKKRKPVAEEQVDKEPDAADGAQSASEGSHAKGKRGKRGDGEALPPPETDALLQQTAAANADKAPASAAVSREVKGAGVTGGEASVAVAAAAATAQPRKVGRLSRKVPQAATAKAAKQPSAPKARSEEGGAEKAVATPASGAARSS